MKKQVLFSEALIIMSLVSFQVLSASAITGLSEVEQKLYRSGQAFFDVHPQIKLLGPNNLSIEDTTRDIAYLSSLPRSMSSREVFELNREALHKWKLFLEVFNAPYKTLAATGALLCQLEKELYAPGFFLQMLWKRPRPCDLLPNMLLMVDKPTGWSYPCIEALEAQVMAAALCACIKDDSVKQAVRSRAECIGQHCVDAGLNFPSDLAEAKRLGEAMYSVISTRTDTQKQLKAACEELRGIGINPSEDKTFSPKPVEVQNLSLDAFLAKLAPLTNKKIHSKVSREVYINDVLDLTNWRMSLDLIAFEHDLCVEENDSSILLFNKQNP